MDAVKTKKYILYSGAYGAGKTFLMCHVVIRTCVQNPNAFIFFGSQTVPMIRDTVVKTFLEEIELYQDAINKAGVDLQITKSWRPSTMTFTFYNNAQVLFRSCDDPTKYKSLNLDAFALDEPVDISEEVFLMLQGRLRAKHVPNRFGVMAGNPAGYTNWVYRKFFDQKLDGYYHVHTTTYDNTHLPSDYIPQMEQSYDEDYKRRYLYGEWGSFEGQIFKDFNINKHVKDLSTSPEDEFQYYVGGYDDGYRNPACLLVGGITRDNKLYILHEYYKSKQTTDNIIKDIEGIMYKYSMKKIYADPSAVGFIEMARNAGLPVVAGDNDVDSGLSKMKAMFANDMFYFDKTCKNSIREYESYRYARDRFNNNLTEKPVKKDDHSPDAGRYLLTNFNPFKKKRIMKVGKFT